MALVAKENPGGGILVDASGSRPVGDTNSSAVYLTDLPTNFHGGEEALHFALGELFGQYGKIKKIELYMQEGILETQDFKGEGLVVFHKTKLTGSREKGDAVYDACTDMDGKWRMLGKRGRRMHCEAAAWQKEGFDVKTKAKLYPCVEISNLWDYDGTQTLSWFANMQEEIRKRCAEHIQQPFVKVEPSAGTANVWVKGASDAMKLAGIMHKSFFMGRKVVAALCRKEKPIAAEFLKAPTGDLTMKLPEEVWDGTGPVLGPAAPPGSGGGADVAMGPVGPSLVEGPAGPPAVEGPSGPPGVFRRGMRAKLRGLTAKPENNGRYVQVYEFLEDLGKYQVVMDGDGKAVKVKPENLQALSDEELLALGAKPKKKKNKAQAEEPEDAEGAEDEAAAAQDVANKMAMGDVRAQIVYAHDPNVDGFLPTVCVDPSLLPKREEPEPEETQEQKRERSRSRERRRADRMEAVKARVEANKADRPKWVMPSPEELAAQAAAAGGGAGGAAASALAKEPEESREELMKLSVGKLKELLTQFGKSARRCIEKRDFVDRLKPAPKE